MSSDQQFAILSNSLSKDHNEDQPIYNTCPEYKESKGLPTTLALVILVSGDQGEFAS